MMTPARRRTAVRRSGVASAGTPLIPGHGTVRRQDHDPHHPRGDTREDPTLSPETDARRRPSRDDHRRHQRPGPDRSARQARRGWHLAGGRARRGRLRRPRQPDAGLRPLGKDLGRPGDGQRLRHDLSHARSGRAGHRGAARQHARRGAGGRRGRQVRAARQARHVHQPPGLRRGRLLQDRQRPEPADGVDRGHRGHPQARRDRQGRPHRRVLRGAERPGDLDGPHRRRGAPGRPEDDRRRVDEDRAGRPRGRHPGQRRQRRALHADGRARGVHQLLPVDPGRRQGARRAGCGGRPRLTRVDRVRLAIVGCGNICQLNAPGYLEHPRCDVVALCDTEWARAELRARQWGITPRIYKDYAELLDDSTVDAVELLTPTYLHAEQIIAALAAGKHVSCQKPIAISVAEADRIAEAVSKARTTFRVTENFLHYPYAPEMPMRSRYYRADEFFEIHGSRGILWVTRCTGEMLDLPPVMLIQGTETTSYQVPMDWRTGFDGAARDFIDGVLEGRQPAQDVVTATKVLQVPLAIYEASRSRRPVAPEAMR